MSQVIQLTAFRDGHATPPESPAWAAELRQTAFWIAAELGRRGIAADTEVMEADDGTPFIAIEQGDGYDVVSAQICRDPGGDCWVWVSGPGEAVFRGVSPREVGAALLRAAGHEDGLSGTVHGHDALAALTAAMAHSGDQAGIGHGGVVSGTDFGCELVGGISDHGDRWSALIGRSSGDLLVHGARIGGAFIVHDLVAKALYRGPGPEELLRRTGDGIDFHVSAGAAILAAAALLQDGRPLDPAAASASPDAGPDAANDLDTGSDTGTSSSAVSAGFPDMADDAGTAGGGVVHWAVSAVQAPVAAEDGGNAGASLIPGQGIGAVPSPVERLPPDPAGGKDRRDFDKIDRAPWSGRPGMSGDRDEETGTLVDPLAGSIMVQEDDPTGGAGDDVPFGGVDDDRVLGGGTDVMTGGSGDDTYHVDNVHDRVIETFDGDWGGFDTIWSSVDFSMPDNVEQMILVGHGNLRGTGNDQGNMIQGNTGRNVLEGRGGDDTLKGQGGDDVLIGDGGDDHLDGGSGLDTAIYHGQRSDYSVKRVASEGTVSVQVQDTNRTDGDDGYDTLTNVEIMLFDDGQAVVTTTPDDQCWQHIDFEAVGVLPLAPRHLSFLE